MELEEIEVVNEWYAKEEKLALFFPICCIFFLVELFLVHPLLSNDLSEKIMALSIHVLLCLISLLIISTFKSFDYDIRFPLLFTILLTFLGPFGAAMTLLVICLYVLETKYLPNSEALLEVLYPDIKISKSTQIYNRITYGMEDLELKKITASYQDIMSFGSLKQKRSALEKIGRYFRPEFVPALQMAINDLNASVRVYAGTIYTQLESQFYNHYLKLEKLMLAKPDLLHTLSFARHCERYVNSEILPADREKKIRTLAIDAYKRCLEILPKDSSILLSLSKLYLGEHQYENALFYIEQLEKNKIVAAEVYLMHMRIYFEQKKYDLLHEFSHREIHVANTDPLANKLREQMELWKGNRDAKGKNRI